MDQKKKKKKDTTLQLWAIYHTTATTVFPFSASQFSDSADSVSHWSEYCEGGGRKLSDEQQSRITGPWRTW